MDGNESSWRATQRPCAVGVAVVSALSPAVLATAADSAGHAGAGNQAAAGDRADGRHRVPYHHALDRPVAAWPAAERLRLGAGNSGGGHEDSGIDGATQRAPAA